MASPMKPGFARRAALILSLDWPGQQVARETVRAGLPANDTADDAVADFMRTVYRAKHAQYGRTFIRITDAPALRRRATAGLPDDVTIGHFVHLDRLIDTIYRQLWAECDPAIRARRKVEAEYLQTLDPHSPATRT
jgi:hypothetical protein